jgi:hypothetical protein
MRKYLLALLISAAVVSCAGLPAAAEEDQGGLVIVQAPHPHQEQTIDHGGMGHDEMMSRGEIMERMMERRRGGTTETVTPPMHPIAMRMIFALIDSDGDGTISLQEFQAAHERLFKAMDSNKDGHLTMEEMQSFMHGAMGPGR